MVNEVVVRWSKTAAKVRVQNNLPVQKIVEKIDGRLLGQAKNNSKLWDSFPELLKLFSFFNFEFFSTSHTFLCRII